MDAGEGPAVVEAPVDRWNPEKLNSINIFFTNRETNRQTEITTLYIYILAPSVKKKIEKKK